MIKRDEIEDLILNHHEQHFTQAKNTPLVSKAVIYLFGISADTKHSKKFRNGKQSKLKNWIDNTVRSFLQCLMPNKDLDPPPIDTNISVENVTQGFKIATL